MKLLQNLSRQLSNKTYDDLTLTGKIRWRLYGLLAAFVLWWKG